SSGQATFSVTDTRAETVTYTGTDITDSNLVITQTASVTFTPGPATHLAVVASTGTITAGTVMTVTVTAQDANNNTVTGYASTIHFTSTDGQAVLPADSTLSNGTGSLNVTLKTAGNQ